MKISFCRIVSFVVGVWFIFVTNSEYMLTKSIDWLNPAAFVLSIIFLYTVKNRLYVFILTATVTVICGIYNGQYIIDALLPLLLIFSYKYALEECDGRKQKNKENEIGSSYITLSIICLFSDIVYATFSGIKFNGDIQEATAIKAVVWLFVFFATALIMTFRKDYDKDKQGKRKAARLRKIFAVALAGLAVSLYNGIPFHVLYIEGEARFYFKYWCIFFLTVCLNSNPVSDFISDRVNGLYIKTQKSKFQQTT